MADADLSIELNHDPEVLLAYTELWVCSSCGRHTAVVIQDQWQCVFCMLQRSGKDHVIVSGWQLTKSAGNQINASRLPPV